MNARNGLMLGVVLLVGVSQLSADDDATETLIQQKIDDYDREAVVINAAADEARTALFTATSETLQTLQARYTREAKLDDAVAVRTQVRALANTVVLSDRIDLPTDAQEIMKQHDVRAAALDQKRLEQLKAVGERIGAPLQPILERLCREEKLDEALAVRDLMRRLKGESVDVEDDPGPLRITPDDVGKVRHYEVTGTVEGAVWGTEVYTGDSYLATAAVHTGILKEGERGIVRVTVLPGLAEYHASTHNGISSHAYGPWQVSFRVERAYGIFRASKRKQNADQESGSRAVPVANPFGR